jgi:hypothetical protein
VKRPRQDLLSLKPHTGRDWGGILGTFIVGWGAAVSVQAAQSQGACAEISGLRAGGICAGQCQGQRRAPPSQAVQPLGEASPFPRTVTSQVGRRDATHRHRRAASAGEPTPATRDPASRARAADQ